MAYTEVQQGIARLFGMDGALMAVGVAGTTTETSLSMESADFDQDFQTEEILGQNGEVETLIASDETYSLTINFVPNGSLVGTASSRAKAIAEAQKIAGAGPITAVETSGFSIAVYNGLWNCMGWTGKMSRDGVFMMTIKLKAYIAHRASIANATVVAS